MKTVFHIANERGHANHGWLDSYHSFSFASYYDPNKIHFGALRVLNDDTVKGGFGFGKHPHDNMEIVSIPLSGDLKHEDSTGRKEIIKQYDVQIMSAGSGIAHSEMNANPDKEVKFLQVWILPKERNITPRYEQKAFKPEDRLNKLQTVVGPNGTEAIYINQDAWFTLGKFEQGFTTEYKFNKSDNGVYAFVLEGEISINGNKLNRRDGLGIWEAEGLNITADSNAELLLIEVPMLKAEN
jgi:redox-sensitive bicupin YhaK (pirin superfamily)